MNPNAAPSVNSRFQDYSIGSAQVTGELLRYKLPGSITHRGKSPDICDSLQQYAQYPTAVSGNVKGLANQQIFLVGLLVLELEKYSSVS